MYTKSEASDAFGYVTEITYGMMVRIWNYMVFQAKAKEK